MVSVESVCFTYPCTKPEECTGPLLVLHTGGCFGLSIDLASQYSLLLLDAVGA